MLCSGEFVSAQFCRPTLLTIGRENECMSTVRIPVSPNLLKEIRPRTEDIKNLNVSGKYDYFHSTVLMHSMVHL